jgi:site-specific recombinase
MNTTTKVTLIIVFFAAITIFVLFVSGMLTGTMDNRWMMGR